VASFWGSARISAALGRAIVPLVSETFRFLNQVTSHTPLPHEKSTPPITAQKDFDFEEIGMEIAAKRKVEMSLTSLGVKSTLSAGLLSLLASAQVLAAEPPQCQQQTVEKSVFEMCLLPGAAFQHDLYTLKADKVLIFALVDDYSENVELEHEIPEGLTIEFPLSKQGEKVVKIRGGCAPESKDGAEVARLCNFHWGKYQVVKDIRFEFK
jgi:hypothetical protein